MLAQLHQLAPVVPPSQRDPSIPTALDQIVLKVLSKEPAARYRTADQLGRVLATFVSGRPALPFEFQVPEAATRIVERFKPDAVDWLAVGLGLLAFLAVGGLFPLWMWVYLTYR
jgi:serine/threonine-protein kinase